MRLRARLSRALAGLLAVAFTVVAAPPLCAMDTSDCCQAPEPSVESCCADDEAQKPVETTVCGCAERSLPATETAPTAIALAADPAPLPLSLAPVVVTIADDHQFVPSTGPPPWLLHCAFLI